jgi:hypothetical protein
MGNAIVEHQHDPASQHDALGRDPGTHPSFERSTVVIGKIQSPEMNW